MTISYFSMSWKDLSYLDRKSLILKHFDPLWIVRDWKYERLVYIIAKVKNIKWFKSKPNNIGNGYFTNLYYTKVCGTYGRPNR